MCKLHGTIISFHHCRSILRHHNNLLPHHHNRTLHHGHQSCGHLAATRPVALLNALESDPLWQSPKKHKLRK